MPVLQGLVGWLVFWMPWIVLGVLVLSSLFLWVRRVVERVERSRLVTLAVVPESGHTMNMKGLVALQSQLQAAVRNQRNPELTRRVDGLTFTHRPDASGSLLLLVTMPRRAERAFRDAFGNIKHVNLREANSVDLGEAPLMAPPGYARPRWSEYLVAPDLVDDGAEAVADPANEGVGGARVAALGGRQLHIARAALVRRGSIIYRLRNESTLEVMNLLGSIAEAGASLDREAGEDLAVAVRFAYLTPKQSDRFADDVLKAVTRAKKGGRWARQGAGGFQSGAGTQGTFSALTGPESAGGRGTGLGEQLFGFSVLGPSSSGRGPVPGADPAARLAELDAIKNARQVLLAQPLGHVEVFIMVRALTEGRAVDAVHSCQSAVCSLDRGKARMAAVGVGFGGRLPFFGPDQAKWFRRWFDSQVSRWRMPLRAGIVQVGEVAPLLGPATDAAQSEHVRRSAPLAPAPDSMPDFDPNNPDLVCKGVMQGRDGVPRLKAMYRSEVQMEADFSGTGGGKTTMAAVDTIHIARSTGFVMEQIATRSYAIASRRAAARGREVDPVELEAIRARMFRIAVAHGRIRGTTFMDPEGAVTSLVMPYLADQEHLVLNVVDVRAGRQPALNPLSMEGLRFEDLDRVVAGLVNSIVSGVGWNQSANRAITLMTEACRALAYYNWLACQPTADHPEGRPDCQATMFSILKLMNGSDSTFRDLLAKVLPPKLAEFWRDEFPQFQKDALPVVSNAFRRLDTLSSPLGALLGRPRNTLDFGRAMDEGHIMFLNFDGQGEADALVKSMAMSMLLRAGLARPDEISNPLLVPHHLVVDEINAFKGMGDDIATMYERARKRRMYVKVLGQSLRRLDETVSQGIEANASVRSVGRFTGDDASAGARLIGLGDPKALGDVELHERIMTYPVNGVQYGPSLVRGVTPQMVYGPGQGDRLVAVAEAYDRMDERFSRKTRAEAEPEISSQHGRIVLFLNDHIARNRESVTVSGSLVPLGGVVGGGS